MSTKIVDCAKTENPLTKTSTKLTGKCAAMLLLLVSVALGVDGCGGYYAGGAAYGPGPYYGSGYAGSTSVVVAVQDRPYYTHGPGYYVGGAYYAWRPGHWSRRGYWVPGHYVLVSR
jgi:hypothetical protein